jgi:hypothetical protein
MALAEHLPLALPPLRLLRLPVARALATLSAQPALVAKAGKRPANGRTELLPLQGPQLQLQSLWMRRRRPFAASLR